MAWYYEILGKNDVLLEQSKPIYRTQWEAQWISTLQRQASYRRYLRRVPVLGNIGTKLKDD